MNVLIKKLNERAEIPCYATGGSAACDLRALLDGPVTLMPGEKKLIPTGLAIALPSEEYAAICCARSGLSVKRGLTLANGIGVVDSDYRGEMMVPLYNTSSEPQTVNDGDRIAQLMIVPVAIASFIEAETLPETDRGAGGFGSTGTK